MTWPELISSEAWLARYLESYGPEIRRRRLQLHRELDPALQLPADPGVDAAIDLLLRFVIDTTPDACPIYLASMRSEKPVARLGEGRLVLRWQVCGRPPARDPVQPIRPRAGDAASHVASERAVRLARAFEAIGWPLELRALAGDRELMARIDFSAGD